MNPNLRLVEKPAVAATPRNNGYTARDVRKKVLLVTNIPTPYRIPLFEELNRQLAAVGIELLVAFGAMGYARRKWKIDLDRITFRYTQLRSRHIVLGKSTEHTLFTYGGLIPLIRKYQPDIIISAGFSISTMKVWMMSRLTGVKYIIWSGSLGLDAKGWRLFVRRILARRASRAIAYGSRAKAYLNSLGIPEGHITIALNTVDTEYFRKRVERLRAANRNGAAKRLTYIGYLTRGKNVIRILEMIRLLRQVRDDFVLDIVGDGDDFPRLAEYVERHGLQHTVVFHGYRQTREIPEFLSRSYCHLFQTDRDVWGLVLVEAMAAGVPCLSSIHAGATHDLIIDGQTGFAVDFENTQDAFDKVMWLLDHPAEASRIGRNAQMFVEQHLGMPSSAESMVDSIRQAI